jgi:endonuclease YncB( thermonuclease family)
MISYRFPITGFRARCTKVIDAVTLVVTLDRGFNDESKRRIRLGGVNTPELRNRIMHAPACRDTGPDCICGAAEEREKAQAAKDFVAMALEAPYRELPGRSGWPLRIEFHKTSKGQERTTFGRYVADVYYKTHHNWVPGESVAGAERQWFCYACNTNTFTDGEEPMTMCEVHLNQQIIDEGHGVAFGKGGK